MTAQVETKDFYYMGIDPGIANTGVACSVCGTTWTEKTAKGDISGRLYATRQALYNHVVTCMYSNSVLGNTRFIMEDFFGSYGKDTIQLIGVLLETFFPLPLKMVQPAQWVRDLFGKKNAGKYKACAMRLAKQTGWKPKDQHQADAAAMVEWGKRFW